ncbi:MAG: hypothetical protein FJ286_17720 [Planctomycetes bacterium]|nr:hypothetical protein [Planctomycetota bacterium]
MAQTAAHLADRVIPPVPVRQWVISVPKRLRCFLADRPASVTALTRIFLDEIERWLDAAVAIVPDAAAHPALRPRLGAVSFLHRFGSALNRHVHLHACVTDGLFMPGEEDVAFLPARPVTPADLLALTERVRTRLVRWFRRHRLLDAEAAADMLAWENSGFSIDASVRIALVDRDVPTYSRSLEHLYSGIVPGPPSPSSGSPCSPDGTAAPNASATRCPACPSGKPAISEPRFAWRRITTQGPQWLPSLGRPAGSRRTRRVSRRLHHRFDHDSSRASTPLERR